MQKVLVIDDDENILDIIDYLLIGAGLKVISSKFKLSVDDVLALNPSLIILEHLLRCGTGSDMCLELKADNVARHIPIILISPHEKLEELAAEHCADAYVGKPFDIHQFEKVVEQLTL